jgi:hypothetical protein
MSWRSLVRKGVRLCGYDIRRGVQPEFDEHYRAYHLPCQRVIPFPPAVYGTTGIL